MQDKHVVLFYGREDREKLINKVEYSKTVYFIDGLGGTPKSDDIITDNKQSLDWIMASYIVDNYDNLHEYTIFTQADPSDHVEFMDLAIKSTFTDKFGSFSYARSIYEQYTFSPQWIRLHAVSLASKILNIEFDNCLNKRKSIYICTPGTIFYVHRDRIRERPKSFYENIIKCDNDDEFFDYVVNYNHPFWLYQEINKLHPELRELSKKDKVAALTVNAPKSKSKYTLKYRQDYFGVSMEPLWNLIFQDKKTFDKLNIAQQSIGNLFSNSENYVHPYSSNPQTTIMNFKLMENNWFDWNCPHYLKWREKLIEKTLWEGQQRGFNGQDLLDYYERIGYKHISF